MRANSLAIKRDQGQRRVTGTHRSLVLHIGKNKAGSTAIQKRIGRLDTPIVKSRLLSAVFRPSIAPIKSFGFPNARLLASAFQSPHARAYFVERRGKFDEAQFSAIGASIWQNVEKELSHSSARHFVGSSEFLWAFLEHDDIHALRQRLSGFFDDVRIVLYLRDQRSDLPSAWAQTVKGPTRSTQSFQEFMDNIEKCRGRWDYASPLKSWLDVFGVDALCVGLFDRRTLRSGDVVADFCHKAGISDSPLSRTTGDANRTPSWSNIEALRYQNHLSLPESTSNAFIESDPSSEIAQAQAKIARLVSCGNRWINATFFEDQPVKLPEA